MIDVSLTLIVCSLDSKMFSLPLWKDIGWVFLKHCDCDGVVRFLMERYPRRRGDAWCDYSTNRIRMIYATVMAR